MLFMHPLLQVDILDRDGNPTFIGPYDILISRTHEQIYAKYSIGRSTLEVVNPVILILNSIDPT